MKFRLSALLVIGFVAVNSIAYTNCSRVKFQGAEAVSPTSIETPAVSGSPLPSPGEAISKCEQLRQLGKLLETEQTIEFADARIHSGRAEVCEFGIGDNLSVGNGFIRARYEQSYDLQLPAGAILCGAELVSPTQSFRFDDSFYFTFNGVVLATSHRDSLSRLSKQAIGLKNLADSVELFSYRWSDLADGKFTPKTVENDYCLGANEGHSVCSWPATEQQGEISFSFDPELLVTIGLKAVDNKQIFAFVTTGDNDRKRDCWHEAVKLETKISYYLQ